MKNKTHPARFQTCIPIVVCGALLALRTSAFAAVTVNTDFSIQPVGILQGVGVGWSDTNATLESRTNLATGNWTTVSNASSPYYEIPGLPADFFRLNFGNVANQPPVANNDFYTVTHDQVLSVSSPGVLANDVDNNNLELFATMDSGPGNGTLILNADGSFDYTPNQGYVGPDSFTYVDSDELGGVSAPATVFITVTNHPPVAQPDVYGVQENGMLYIAPPGVLVNDTDADGDALTAVLSASPFDGTVTLNSDGSFIYTPNSNYVGSDSFTYYDDDGITNGNTVTVTLNVHSNNTPPVAVGSSYTMAEGTILPVSAPGVLTGATDADGDSLSAELVSGPSDGTLNLSGDGSFQYTPTSGFTGNDTFTFEAFDGLTNGNTATVTITVTNSQPMASVYTYYVHVGAVLSVPPSGVLLEDASPINDPLVAQQVSPPSLGTMLLNGDGSFDYTNISAGVDTFTYEAVDTLENSTSAPALVTIIATNRPPVAVADAYGVLTNTTLNVPAPGVLVNDTDPDGDSLNVDVSSVTRPANGAVAMNADGSFAYTPDSGFVGTDTFTYAASDGLADSAPAIVSVNVHATNATLLSNPGIYAIRPDEILIVSNDESVLLADDSDSDGDVLTATLLTSPANGSLSFDTNGDFVYTPNDEFVGQDSFTYQPNDGPVAGTPTTVYINIQNSAPVAVSDVYTFHFLTTNDTVTNYVVGPPGVLENDSDADQDELTADLVSSTTNGVLQFDEDGSFTYTPNPGFVGTDTFTYVADDGYTTSEVTTVTLDITDTAPVAEPDYFYTAKNTALSNAAPGALENAYDADADPLTAVLVSPTSNGSLTLNPDGSFLYTPNNGFVGTDQFTYSAYDGGLTSAPVAISIDVTNNFIIILAAKPAPLAQPQAGGGGPSAVLSQLTFDNVIQTPNIRGITPTGRAIYSDWVGSAAIENGYPPVSFDGRAWDYGWRWGTGNGYIPSTGFGRYPYIYVRNNALAATVMLSLANIAPGSKIALTGDVYWNGQANKLFQVIAGLVGVGSTIVPSQLPAGNLNGTVSDTLKYTFTVGAGPGGANYNGLKTPDAGGPKGQWATTTTLFPNFVGSNVMTIIWHYNITPPGKAATTETICGVSKHIIYLTFGQTVLERNYWTVTDAGCKTAPAFVANLNLQNQNAYIGSIFQTKFRSLFNIFAQATPAVGNLTRVDGAPLSFYGTAIQPSFVSPYWRTMPQNTTGWRAPQSANAPNLLRYGAGLNYAWADLFRQMLWAQGLKTAGGTPVGTFNTITAKNNNDGFLLAGTMPGVGAAPFKAASFQATTTADTRYPTYQTAALAGSAPPGPGWRFLFRLNLPRGVNVPGGISTPQRSAINGQNDATGLVLPGFNTASFGRAPNWWFADCVVNINNTLYDPSYGMDCSFGDLQAKLVDGTFGFPQIINNSVRVFNMEAKAQAKDVGKLKIRFITMTAVDNAGNSTVNLKMATDKNFNAGGAIDNTANNVIKLMYWNPNIAEWKTLKKGQAVMGVFNFNNLKPANNPGMPATGFIRATADWYGDTVISY